MIKHDIGWILLFLVIAIMSVRFIIAIIAAIKHEKKSIQWRKNIKPGDEVNISSSSMKKQGKIISKISDEKYSIQIEVRKSNLYPKD